MKNSGNSACRLAAAIVETRSLPELPGIISNHMRFLPEGTQLFIFNSHNNAYVEQAFPKAIIKKVYIRTEYDYNVLVTKPEFWENFSIFDRVLIFQSDSVIFRTGIEEFYNYGYVGAPWKNKLHGGNGGCSLRDPKLMADICKRVPWDKTLGNEDYYFSDVLHKESNPLLAPRDICLKWGVETVFSLGTFCGHAYDKYLTVGECNQIDAQLHS